jgi:hypothetical protein
MKNTIIKKLLIVSGTVIAACGVSWIGVTNVIADKKADIVAPRITVDFQEYEYNNLPIGQTNLKYPVFEATAFDTRDGIRPVEVKVVKKDTNKNLYDLGTNTFTPTSAGVYTLIYEASDENGNIASLKYGIVIEDSVASPKIVGEIEDNYYSWTGKKFSLSNAFVEGGSGYCSMVGSILLDGKEVYAFSSFSNSTFTPQKSGTYTVNYSVYDYLTRSDSVSYTITVENSNEPIIDEMYLPEYAISGTKFTFEDFVAFDYSGDGVQKETEKLVIVEYANERYELSADESFVAQPIGEKGSKSDMLITLQAVGQHGVATNTQQITIVNVKSGQQNYLPAYMIGTEKISVDNSAAMKYKTSAVGESLKGVKAFVANGFSFGFKTSGVKKATLILSDLLQEDLQVKISLVAIGDGTNMLINDKAIDGFSSSLQFGSSMLFSYDATGHSIKFNAEGGNTLRNVGSLSTFTNGETFNGFPSGKINFTFVFDELSEEEGTISVETLANVNISTDSVISDFTAPNLAIESFPKTRVELGEEIIIPRAIAEDVLSDLAYFSLNITAPDGTEILKNGDPYSGYKFIAEQYGTYMITYNVADTNYNKPLNTKRAVTVVERVAPTIVLNGNMPASVNKNATISFPSFEVSDNLTETEDLIAYIVVVTPSFQHYVIFEEEGNWMFTPTNTGLHTIKYYVEDADGNCNILEFKLLVKE